MKKNIVNDKVIRAMAIGISAMLATATPMTALAAEEGNDGEGAKDAGQESQPASDVQKAGDDASDSAATAKGSTDTVKNDVKNVVAGEATDSDGNDLAQDVIDAAALTENTTDEEKGSSVAGAANDINNANIQVDVAEANDKLSDTEYSKAENAAAAAASDVEDVKEAMDVANAKADEQVQQIENAASVEDANAAYDELKATAEQAQKEFDAKLEDYNKAKDAYNEAAAKVKEYEDAYNLAVENAGTNAADAWEKLEKAKENAKELEDAVAAAKYAVGKSAEEAMAIAEQEYLTEHDGGLIWGNEDKLFIAIMENYYLPEKLNIQGATVTRVQGKDNNEYNYFTAEYVDENGNPQVKYFNFKMDDNGKSKDNIVIFEKREVETKDISDVLLREYDVCVDQNGNEVDVDEAIKDGTISKYVEKNDMTGSETLVPNSEITETSTTDVTVDEKTEKVSWSYNEETGELVKTVTADVTTITYTEATFTSDQSYATDAERDEAAAAKEKELEDATGKDATIHETEETTNTYTANGTYIPTFTKTVEVNKEYESGSGYLWGWADSKKEAQDKALDWAKDKIDDDLDDYYLIGDIQSNLSVSMTEEETETYKIFGKKHTVVTDDSDYLVTGTVTATYAKVTRQTVDQSTFGALWDDIKALFTGGQPTNEKLKEAAKKAVEADGGIFLTANWDDWSFNKATIRYVAGVKVTTDEKQTEKDAENAVKKTALEQAKANGASGVYNVKTTGTDAIAHTTYSYSVDYLQKTSEETKNKPVATETYGDASGLSGQIIQNKNYYDAINKGERGKILLTQKDEDYRQFVDVASKYVRLLKEAEKAHKDVAKAQAKVNELQKKIEALKGESNNKEKLADLEAELVIAEANKEAAEKTLDDIIDKLKDAETTRDEVVDKLTPKKPGGGSDGNPGGTGGNGGNPGGGTPGTTYGDLGTDTTTDGPATVVTTTTTAAATANTAVAAQAVAANGAGVGNVAAGNAGAGNAAGNVAAGNQGVVTIEDEASPLAASIDDQDTTDTEQNKEDAQTVTIEDEASPLDASIDQEKMSWWWLLIVLVLGATGYEMYRKHQEKKKAAEEIKVEE